MGMYTELHYNVELQKDTPQDVLAMLAFMVRDRDDEPALLDHPLFACERWRYLFTMDSYYFAADTHSTLRLDDISKQYYLCVRSNLKNYDDEIAKFVDWIDPYVDAYPGDFLGFFRYEETETPTLIYKQGDAT
jgi:hypothetical protein